MKKSLFILVLILSSLSLSAQHFEIDTLSMTGPVDQRINMVFLSDGYQQAQLANFIKDAKWMMEALFAKQPYSKYRDFFNCFAIKVPSEVSGAAEDPTKLINNYFGSTFNYAGIWRLVVPTRTDRVSKVLADNFPFYDQVFMIVNDSRYGGSGGWIATSTVNTDGPEICIHELGHSFGGLSDEYWAGAVYARENTNMTQVNDTAKVKWKRWLGYSSTGIYSHSESPLWYRPHQNCEMRYLKQNFCPVCKEQITTRILDLTNPVISYSPADESIEMTTDMIFKVHLLAPTPNTQKIWWELNRNEISGHTDSINLSVKSLLSKENNLTCFVLDTTAFIRNPEHPSAHLSTVSWAISYSPSGIDLKVLTDQVTVSVFPNPAYETLTLSYKTGLPSSGKILVRILDSSGKQVSRSFSMVIKESENNFPIPLPNRQLKEGIYYIQVQAPNHTFTLPVVINQNRF